jgi:Na+-transporting NADH:ubiquinone oxidoreductase subunit C
VFSNRYTVFFVVTLCLSCALILSVMATSIRTRQEAARQLDIAKQMLQAAQIYNYQGHFQIEEDGKAFPARWEQGKMVRTDGLVKATSEQINQVFEKRLRPVLVDSKGEVKSFKDAGIDEQAYINDNRVSGYYKLPEKLVYEILDDKGEPTGYIVPVAGFGLWGPIYGYLALGPDADTVIGNTWEAPAETPGLGAIVTSPKWQAQFEGKKIFLSPASGEPDYKTASLGITVVKGKVRDVYGDTPRAQSAVDGISGATLTGDGVTAAFKDSLAPYRPFLAKAGEKKK